MKLIHWKLGELETNCYLLMDPRTREGIIIDPADEADFLGEQILKHKIKIKALVATHGHFDHLLAAGELQQSFKIPFFIHQKDLPLLKKFKVSANWWLAHPVVALEPKPKFLKEGDTLYIGPAKLQVISTPGHTPGSICLWEKNQDWLFSGDTLFTNGVGRTDLPYSNFKDLKKSLLKLSQIGKKITLFPGHGQIGTTVDLPQLSKLLGLI